MQCFSPQQMLSGECFSIGEGAWRLEAIGAENQQAKQKTEMLSCFINIWEWQCYILHGIGTPCPFLT
ncbi:hypothetical protein V6N13_027631 [Hibiscus sabdariffa]|uniref:Uncharacterized protein n=1 Tax=Hibiscus sabdariffa TaxID=183260 RepID=A0ABR2CFH5_9ROSI